MNLDERARRAARALHDAANPTALEVPAAVDRLHAEQHRRRRRDRTARVAAGLLAVVGLAGGAAVVAWGTNGDDDGERVAIQTTTTPSTTPETTTTTPPSEIDRQRFELVPASPIDGKNSYRLPVVATPQRDLVDGQAVTLLGKGFEPGERLGIVQCAAEGVHEAIPACDLGGDMTSGPYSALTYVDADANGEVEATIPIRRHITTPNDGAVDCASAAERCMVGIGALADYDRSGSTFLHFAGSPPFPTPQVTVPDADRLRSSNPIEVTVDAWLPERSIRIEQCNGDACATLADGVSTLDGRFSAMVQPTDAVVDRRTPNAAPVPCTDGCTIRAVPIDLEGATSMIRPEPVPVAFIVISAEVPMQTGTTPTLPGPITSGPSSTTTSTSNSTNSTTTTAPAPAPGDS